MTASSRHTRAISSEVGDIERRLRILQNGIEKLGTRASSNARDTADGLGEAVASALSSWADRFRQGTDSSESPTLASAWRSSDRSENFKLCSKTSRGSPAKSRQRSQCRAPQPTLSRKPEA